MVVVDGIAAEVDLTATPVTDGVTVLRLADAIASGHPGLDTLFAPSLAADTDVFVAGHAAFGGDGALVDVAAGVVAGPVLVRLHTATARVDQLPDRGGGRRARTPRRRWWSTSRPRTSTPITVPLIQVAAGPASLVKLSIIQHLGPRLRQVGALRATVDRDATLALAEAGLGGRLARLHLMVDLEGRGSSANVVGTYFGDGDQVMDYRYFMHHAGLDTRSDMFLKGAVEDRALSVFTGLIRIDEGAQRTDAYQTNRNLILSEGAAAQSVPNLEILANDVKCGHGSSVGPLDEEQRYYLMSRGLDRSQADRLQVRGFFEQALTRFPHPEVTDAVREWVNAKYVTAQEEGRV